MKKTFQDNDDGFTLIEVIVSIIIAAIFGTIVVQYTSSGLSSSSISLHNIKESYEIEKVIEGFTLDYRYWLENDPTQTITHFKTNYIDTYAGDAAITTDTSDITSGDSAAGVQVLSVAVSNGEQTLYTLFTK